MEDPTPPQKPRPLSEISHLFLSSIRGQGQSDSQAPRSRRVPPGGKKPIDLPPTPKPQSSIDMTAQEFEQMFGVPCVDEAVTKPASSVMDSAVGEPTRAPVVGVVLAEPSGDRVTPAKLIASTMVAHGVRTGIIGVDQGEIRVLRVEFGDVQMPVDSVVPCADHIDERQLSECLLELDSDIDQWLLVSSDLRSTEARHLMRQVDEWVVVTCGDHDGVVAGYRTLKGMAELGKRRTRVAMSSRKHGEELNHLKAERTWIKLAGVSRQFLDWEVEFAGVVEATPHIVVNTVYHASALHDKAQLASGVQWRVIGDFLGLEKRAGPTSAEAELMGLTDPVALGATEGVRIAVPDVETPTGDTAVVETPVVETCGVETPTGQTPVEQTPVVETFGRPVAGRSTTDRPAMPNSSQQTIPPLEKPMMQLLQPTEAAMDEVVELVPGTSVLSAVLGSGSGMMTCPIDVPMCEAAKVAIDRDRSLVLVASAGAGLTDLPAVTSALKWLGENRKLIAMALPQMSIDTHASPRLMLLVEHGERCARVLSPLLTNPQVTIRSYRKLRWGGRMGVLLEAA